MKYWWVNQNQTFRHEVTGRYMWSPKRNRNGVRSQFYENMKEVAPGDVVFSFNNKLIANIGIAISHSYEATRPVEFGNAGNQWDAEGWKVDVDYEGISSPLRPSEHMDVLAPTLPPKYSPIRKDGVGNQVYLARIPLGMARALIGLIGFEAQTIVDRAAITKSSQGDAPEEVEARESREREIVQRITNDPTITETEKKHLVASRRGQGLFRKRVALIERRCRVTGVTNLFHRVASHIKPWRKANNQERLDGENGLLLAPHIDHLFDKGFISFAADGTLLISPAADLDALRQMGLPMSEPFNAGSFTPSQLAYLTYHRSEVFKKAVAR